MNKEKVFGVGLSRTGTTSLTGALDILNYKAIHYPSYFLDYDLKIKIKEEELEKYDVLTDVPVAYLFKELDEKYPNAKFILTVRPEDTWLTSVSKFFTRPESATSKGVIIDFLKCLKPKNKVWRALFFLRYYVYGAFKFDKNKYLNGYRKHNTEVIKHFKGREDKLLVVDLINEENKWDKICEFLNEDIPSKTFPHSNNSQKKVN